MCKYSDLCFTILIEFIIILTDCVRETEIEGRNLKCKTYKLVTWQSAIFRQHVQSIFSADSFIYHAGFNMKTEPASSFQSYMEQSGCLVKTKRKLEQSQGITNVPTIAVPV